MDEAGVTRTTGARASCGHAEGDAPPRRAAPLPAVAALALATAACGGGNEAGSAGPGAGTGGASVLKPSSDAEAARFLLRAGLSASTADIAEVRSRGYAAWLNARMGWANDQTGAAFMAARGYERVDANRWYDQTRPGDNMIWSQLLSGGNPVRKRMALALSEFFVVSLTPLDMTWRSSAITAYWDILNEHAFGDFRDLLEAVTLNPAMGVFLNTLGNRKADARSGRVPDENYGREVMQLFSIGLFELNEDGTVRTGADGRPLETYTNDDVSGIARCFTGYDYDGSGTTTTPAPDNAARLIPDAGLVRRPMTADPAKWRNPRTTGEHSPEEKRFLGTTIPAGTGAAESLRLALDTLVRHPNVGPLLGRQLIQRLVTSNPSPAYVARVARVFADNGAGGRGDLAAVFRAVLLDAEALDPAGLADPRFGKLREPMLRLVQWGRTFGAGSASGDWSLGDLSDPAGRLGQAPLRAPSVFNFFRPGYVPAGSQAAANSLLAPEFGIVNETSVAGYVNFIERTIDGRGSWMADVKARYADELAIAHDAAALLDRLDLLLTARQLSGATRETILGVLNADAVTQTSDETTKLRRVHLAVFLVMVSADYLVQR